MRGRKKTFIPDEALDRAMALFWKQGYEATGMQALLDEMEVARQSLYDTFGNKHELYAAALARYDQVSTAQIHALLEAPGSPLENLRRLVRIWQMRSTAQPFSGCLVNNTAIELSQHDADFAALARTHLQKMEAALQTTLDRAQTLGELDPARNTRRLARLLLALWHGTIVLGKANLPPELIHDVIEETLTLLDG